MTTFAFVFPGPGLAVGRHARRLGRPPGGARRRSTKRRRRSAKTSRALIHEGPKEQLDLTTNTQPVMLTAGVACYRAWLAETRRRAGRRRRPFARRVHGAGRRRRAELRRRAAAGALSRAGDAGGGAGRRRARWRRSSASTPQAVRDGCAEAARGHRRGRRGGQLQRSEADRDRRHQGRRRQGLRAAQGRRAPSARCCCRCRRRSIRA